MSGVWTNTILNRDRVNTLAEAIRGLMLTADSEAEAGAALALCWFNLTGVGRMSAAAHRHVPTDLTWFMTTMPRLLGAAVEQRMTEAADHVV